MPKNKLVFAFQKNIVKSKKFEAYKEWFEFAEATQNRNNKKQDFEKFKKNESLMMILHRIKTDTLAEDELDELGTWDRLEEEREYIQSGRYLEDRISSWADERVKERMPEVKRLMRQEVRQEVQQEINEKVRQEIKAQIISAHELGLDNTMISKIMKLTVEEIIEIIEIHKKETIQ